MSQEVDVSKAHKVLAGELLRNPDNPHVLIAQMALLSDNGKESNWPHYLCLARRAWRQAPDDIRTMFIYGSALGRADQYEQAAEMFRQCLARNDPKWQARCLHHLGISYRNLGENKKAIGCFEQALELTPERIDYKKDLAIALLADGDLVRGLDMLEIRNTLAELKLVANRGELVNQIKLPVGFVPWQGESLEGKSIVVCHQDGSGDFIQMCRFIPMLRERGVRSIRLTGPVPDLLELVSDNIRVDGIVPLAGPWEAWECDYVVGSMSLPWRCGTTLQDVNGKPYLHSLPAQFPQRGLLSVGMQWQGNKAYGKDYQRSMPLSALCPLFEIPDVAFYSLQCGEGADQVEALGFEGFIGDLGIKGWRPTAAIIKALDVIISVDNAIAHLAGALGVPVFILVANNCDWRWDRNSAHSVWYDSARVIRQYVPGDWSSCVSLVKMNLEDMVNERRSARGADRQSTASISAA